MRKSTRGFTIVELLIVIVVIAILAAISIVAYNGVQDRATYNKYYAGISQVKKALDLYYAEHNRYPVYTSFTYYCQNPSAFLSEITTSSIASAPCTNSNLNYDSYTYRSSSNGQDYKLIYIRPAMSQGALDRVPSSMQDSRWNNSATDPARAWGYWTPGGSSF